MDAGKIRLLELIGANKKTFNIPVYQRNYDWKRNQCERLFKDIENIAKSNNEIEHFLGTIVYVVEKTLPTFTEYILIDGQQRITSMMLLIKALHTLIVDESKKQDINESFLINRHVPEKYKIKLKSIESDRKSFEDILEEKEIENITDSNIINNYLAFIDLIKQSKIDCLKLYDALNYIDIVFISLEKGKKSENPQMIFESLNSTGLSLTQADLIRNYLLMNHTYEKQERLYNKYWLEIEKKITNSKISDYVRDYLTMKTGKISVKLDVYIEFKEYVIKNSKVDEEIVLDELLNYSKYYSWFLLGTSDHKYLNDLLVQIQQLKSTVIYPTLLFLFKKCFEDKKIEREELENILKIFISYLYRRMICGYATNALNKIFASFPSDLEKNRKTIYKEKVLEILANKTGTALFPRNDEFKEMFITKKFYGSKKLDMYTLYQLEKYKNKEVINISNDITIEHIMPQTLNAAWKANLGKKFDEIYSKFLHTIGNLTLTAYNSNLSNNNFKEKKEILSKSNIAISRNISDYLEWDEKSIKDRAEKLYEIAKEIWNLPEEYNKNLISEKEFDYNMEYNITDNINFTGEIPRKVIIADEEHSIDSWRELLKKISTECYHLDKEIFKSLINHKDFESLKNKRINNTDTGMLAPYQLGKELYIDTHGSAVEILNYCILIAEKYDK